MPHCKKCGQYFAPNHVRFRVAMHPTRCMERKPTNTNQIYCPKHSFWMTRGGGKHLSIINAKAAELKKAADESGNPKIYRAGEYSQEFLRSLIPRM